MTAEVSVREKPPSAALFCDELLITEPERVAVPDDSEPSALSAVYLQAAATKPRSVK